MAINNEQLAILVNKLYDRTRASAIRWDSTLGQSRYQTRIGDFLVQLSGGDNALEPDIVNLDVKRLSGAHVATVTTSMISMIGRRTAITDDVRHVLRNLFALLDNKSNDLDELINMIP